MENQNKPKNNEMQKINHDLNQQKDSDLNANSTYSGSGSMQPDANTGQADNDLSDDSLAEVEQESDVISQSNVQTADKYKDQQDDDK